MNCPHCQADSWVHVDRDANRLMCSVCGLTGRRDVLEALAARLGPAGTLAEAERLLRGARVSEVQFYGCETIVLAPWSDHGHAATLAEAYEKVRGGSNG